jgi:hemoglobin-like flavoprotein
MDTKNVREAAGTIRRLWEKHGIQQPLRFLGFCLSLLPVPVIQQAGLALDRHLGDKQFAEEVDALWREIRSANEKVEQVATLEEAILEIAETVKSHSELLDKTRRFSESLGAVDSTFSVLTDEGSYQEIVNSLIRAARVSISSQNRSTNVIENTRVESPHTHLHASGGSKNYVDGSEFTDGAGAVSMHGISTQGNIHVSGSSVGLGANSAIIFGGNPNLVTGNCPSCSKVVQVDKRRLVGFTQIQCPHCQRVFPYSIG